jgi:hypothetical protein
MKPLGLTCRTDGELMVVHMCQRCGKVSYNRIAGDDNTYVVLELLGDKSGFLTKNDVQQVQTALFGQF